MLLESTRSGRRERMSAEEEEGDCGGVVVEAEAGDSISRDDIMAPEAWSASVPG